MRVLVTWGSKRGSTEGIGRELAQALAAHGVDAIAEPVAKVRGLEGFDAVVVGGALYANRWPPAVHRFVNRHVDELRKVPVWFFSSGPLDERADREDIPPPTEVAVLAERVGARDHVTFGGRLRPDARGFPASAMARKKSGDWRNLVRIREWAEEVAAELPGARPGMAVDHPARSVVRLLLHPIVGWGVSAAIMGVLLHVASLGVAVAVHAIVTPLVFAVLAWHYFRARGARDPLPTALTWTALVTLLDGVVMAEAIQRSPAMLESIGGTWLPLGLIFLVTWTTGSILSIVPSHSLVGARRPRA